mgnify:CR=1 FL=1
MDYKKALSTGLPIENLNISVKWNINKDALLSMFDHAETRENREYNYWGCHIKAKVLGIDEANVTFNFVKNKMTSVSISGHLMAASENLVENYEMLQNHLESILGKPNNLSKIFFNIFNSKGEKSFCWKFGKITIKHSLFERFGLQEYLEILIK